MNPLKAFGCILGGIIVGGAATTLIISGVNKFQNDKFAPFIKNENSLAQGKDPLKGKLGNGNEPLLLAKTSGKETSELEEEQPKSEEEQLKPAVNKSKPEEKKLEIPA